MMRAVVVGLGTAAVVLAAVRHDAAGNDRPELLLRQKVASAEINAEGAGKCTPSSKSDIDSRIVSAPRQAQGDRLYVEPSEPLTCSLLPTAFYLDLKSAMQDGYRVGTWKALGAMSRRLVDRRSAQPRACGNLIRSAVEKAIRPSRSAIETLQAGMVRLEESSRRQMDDLQRRVEDLQSSVARSFAVSAPSYASEPTRHTAPTASRQASTASRVREGPSAADVERAGLQILDLVEPQGRNAPLASIPGLAQWLAANEPGIEARPVGGLNHDLWRLVVLTADQKEGVAIPALDLTIGPGEVMRWYRRGGYDGTQVLGRANVRALARAQRNPAGAAWIPAAKGVIELS